MTTAAVEARETPPLMRVLRGDTSPAGRISSRHIDLRDAALGAFDRAHAAIAELEAIERGDTHEQVLSPRFDDVRHIREDLGSLRERLDRVYV